MKSCKDCKWCETNALRREYKKLSILGKLRFIVGEGDVMLLLDFKHPKCTHPKVGKHIVKWQYSGLFRAVTPLFCVTARAYDNITGYTLCGSDARYFERCKQGVDL